MTVHNVRFMHLMRALETGSITEVFQSQRYLYYLAKIKVRGTAAIL